MRKPNPVLTEQELEIMKIVWDLETATVREVYEVLRERRNIAYTTVMTTMNILERKKHLRKRLQNRAYLYRPSRPKQQVIKTMIGEFVDRVFNGSAQPLLVHLVEDRKISDEELEEIVRLVKERR